MNWYTLHFAATNPIDRVTAGLCKQAFDIIKTNVVQRKQYNSMEFQLFPNISILDSILPEDIKNSFSKVFRGVFLFIEFPPDMKKNFNTSGVAGITIEDQGVVIITVHLNRDFSEKDYRDFYNRLQFTIRHEFEHFVQLIINKKDVGAKGSPDFHNSTSNNDFWNKFKEYYLNPLELEAFVTGFYYQAKKTKKPFQSIVSQYLQNEAKAIVVKYHIHPEEVYKFISLVYDKYLEYAKQRYPNLNRSTPLGVV